MSQKTTFIFISILLLTLSAYLVTHYALGVSIGGNLDMSDNKIINLGTPTSNTDANTKAYVDTAVAGAGGGPGDWDCVYDLEAGIDPIPGPIDAGVLLVNLQCPIGYQRIVGGCNFWPFTSDTSITENQPWNGGYDYHNQVWYDPSQTGWYCQSDGTTRLPYARIWCCK